MDEVQALYLAMHAGKEVSITLDSSTETPAEIVKMRDEFSGTYMKIFNEPVQVDMVREGKLVVLKFARIKSENRLPARTEQALMVDFLKITHQMFENTKTPEDRRPILFEMIVALVQSVDTFLLEAGRITKKMTIAQITVYENDMVRITDEKKNHQLWKELFGLL